MNGTTSKTEMVGASLERVREVILDLEAYPEWQREMRKVVVLDRDDEGRPVLAQFDISAMGQAASYTLKFEYPAPNTIVSHLTLGDMITKQDQRYTLQSADGKTELRYELDIAMKWQIPEFMRDAIIKKGVKNSLAGIKKVAETN